MAERTAIDDCTVDLVQHVPCLYAPSDGRRTCTGLRRGSARAKEAGGAKRECEGKGREGGWEGQKPPGIKELTRRAPVLSARKLTPMPQRFFLVKERVLAPSCCWLAGSRSLSLLQSQQNILRREDRESLTCVQPTMRAFLPEQCVRGRRRSKRGGGNKEELGQRQDRKEKKGEEWVQANFELSG